MNPVPEPLDLWGVALPRHALTAAEADYLAGLPDEVPTTDWVWSEMDRVWHDLGLDNTLPLGDQPVEEFYRHPVWLMNGVFTATDPESAAHRTAVAGYAARLDPQTIADYGGGFGELARAVGHRAPSAVVSIVEPFPSGVARDRVAGIPGVDFVERLEKQSFDVVIAQDVLEHVEHPVTLAIELATGVRPGGTIIFANHFEPVIACHLPSTFYLLHTFPIVMRALGLRYQGVIDGADHAQIFVVPSKLRPGAARRADRVSHWLAPVIGWIGSLLPQRLVHDIRVRILKLRQPK